MKKIIIILISMAFVVSLNAQSFFKPLPKKGTGRLMLATDSTMNAIRPVANLASYAFPGNLALVGGGVSYQHLKWDVDVQKWKSIWSVSGLVWYSTDNTVLYGLNLGFLNNLFMAGAATNGNKIYGTFGLGVSLNN